MYHQFNTQILRSAHTVYLCVICVSQNKQRLFLYKLQLLGFYNRDGEMSLALRFTFCMICGETEIRSQVEC